MMGDDGKSVHGPEQDTTLMTPPSTLRTGVGPPPPVPPSVSNPNVVGLLCPDAAQLATADSARAAAQTVTFVRREG
jgi:hypothetical protein